jgi:uncharacterized Zn finger protein
MGRWDDEFEDDDEFDDDDDDEDEDDEDDDEYRYYRQYRGWNYYRESKPIKVQDGLKTRSERGSIGSTWWSKRWIAVLESFSMGTRLTRGRSYARQGQVVSIDVEPGVVKARVQGSQPRPYKVEIRLTPLSDHDWEQVIEVMASQAIFAAKLLAGEMPTDIEEAFHTARLSLFPTSASDLVTDCSCPDWANPCKHIAAVYYLLAERFDEDPFLIFKLRGRSKEQIIQSLRDKRAAALPAGATPAEDAEQTEESAPEDSLPLEFAPESFWLAGDALDTFAINPDTPHIDKAILKRLGDAPYEVEGQPLARILAKVYDAVNENM